MNVGRKISEYLTDSAGNVIYGIKVTIKLLSSSGGDESSSITVEEAFVNSRGMFVTNPLPNGVYGVYSGNMLIKTINHFHDITIPTVKPLKTDIDTTITRSMPSYAAEYTVSEFKSFIGIDTDLPMHSMNTINAVLSGNQEFDSTSIKGFWDYYKIGEHASDKSGVTTSRFNVEYTYSTEYSNRKSSNIKWMGVPGIRYAESSKIVLPLDYYSMVQSFPYQSISGIASSLTTAGKNRVRFEVKGNQNRCLIFIIPIDGSGSCFQDIDTNVSELSTYSPIGSIVRVSVNGSLTSLSDVWYGIVSSRTIFPGYKEIVIEPLRSSRYMSPLLVNQGFAVTPGTTELLVQFFDGMQSSFNNLPDYINNRFRVTECSENGFGLYNSEPYTYTMRQP